MFAFKFGWGCFQVFMGKSSSSQIKTSESGFLGEGGKKNLDYYFSKYKMHILLLLVDLKEDQ